MSVLGPILHSPRPQQPFILLQSSVAQSSLPLLRQILVQTSHSKHGKIPGRTMLFCVFYHPTTLYDGSPASLEVYDLLDSVPGYSGNYIGPIQTIFSAVKNAPSGPLTVVVDSLDTLLSDIGSVSETYAFLHELMSFVQARPSPSRLVVHVVGPSQLIPLVSQPAFSPSLTHLIAHPPVLLNHLASEYLTPPPPPGSPSPKFWSVFLPVSERPYESERLVFGAGSEGSGGNTELAVEVLVRGDVEGSGRRRGVERVLEGWSGARGGACDLTSLESLKNIWTSESTDKSAPDPTQNVPFNLNLTPSQLESRARVPLPYAHEGELVLTSLASAVLTVAKGKPIEKQSSTHAQIFYDPDSADDIDDDDPDEDLDI